MATWTPPVPKSPPIVRVIISVTPGEQQELRFSSPFRIGRTEDCHVTIRNEYVSRAHAEVFFDNGRWSVRDLGSANGIFVEGKRVPDVAIEGALTIRLGVEGPFVSFAVELPPPPPPPPPMQAAYRRPNPRPCTPHGILANRHRESPPGRTRGWCGRHSAGPEEQKRRYHAIVAGLLVLIAGVGAYAYYQQSRIAQQTATAKELFYAMKSLRVDIATVEQLVKDQRQPAGGRAGTEIPESPAGDGAELRPVSHVAAHLRSEDDRRAAADAASRSHVR